MELSSFNRIFSFVLDNHALEKEKYIWEINYNFVKPKWHNQDFLISSWKKESMSQGHFIRDKEAFRWISRNSKRGYFSKVVNKTLSDNRKFWKSVIHLLFKRIYQDESISLTVKENSETP